MVVCDNSDMGEKKKVRESDVSLDISLLRDQGLC